MSGDAARNEPPGLNARREVKGDLFSSKQDLTTAVTQTMLGDGQIVRIGGGGGRQASYRRHDSEVNSGKEEVGCMFTVKACKQQRTAEWKITFVNNEHVNCSAKPGKRGPGARVVEHLGATIVANILSNSDEVLPTTMDRR